MDDQCDEADLHKVGQKFVYKMSTLVLASRDEVMPIQPSPPYRHCDV
jgi:hypothetical protein